MARSFLRKILKISLKPGSTVERAPSYPLSLSKLKVSHLSILPSTKTPWLMLPSDVKTGSNGPTDNFFNILDRSLVKLDRHEREPDDLSPIPEDLTCIGSTRGWVVCTSDTDNCAYLACPYIDYFSNDFPGFGNGSSNGFHYSLCKDTFSGKLKLVSLVRLFEPVLASAIWNNMFVYNLLWVKESSEVKICYFDLTRFNFNFGFNSSKIAGEVRFADQVVDDDQRLLSSILIQDRDAMRAYLVVSEPGRNSKERSELYLVIVHLQVDAGETHNIDLLKIDFDRKKLRSVKSIGDQMIFVGENSEPFILSTRDYPGLKSNSVYVAEDLGYYDLETKCFTPFLLLGDLTNTTNTRPQVCWIAPPQSSLFYNLIANDDNE